MRKPNSDRLGTLLPKPRQVGRCRNASAVSRTLDSQKAGQGCSLGTIKASGAGWEETSRLQFSLFVSSPLLDLDISIFF